MRTYSPELRAWLKPWECVGGVPILEPHWDRFGKVWDIGFGHVFLDDEPRRAITAAEAEDLLDWDLYLFDLAVDRLVDVEVEQYRYDALVSFSYNVGSGRDGLGGSTLLRKLNAGDFGGALAEFPRWNKSGGVVVSVLTRRRAAEQFMFANGDYSRMP